MEPSKVKKTSNFHKVERNLSYKVNHCLDQISLNLDISNVIYGFIIYKIFIYSKFTKFSF